eukprot:CAMPEP_0175924772 /NCGR_PEP_ID=MMETSP0108-20121206/15293_1 /TAXON_ID=195067 ORGANISM="Goniomonas pacifica, Strain CCMP1869" /NCGR_SAMPLE_ID=MMETSP0108 /ASSEMBLY_ACC=CAM_ASM_000204 /LENGTH=110 /DNA_ID=CAMNT_0017247883 /DNA_START=13 /DNA_END=345 /DNA_ORIENTATION=-
MAWVQQLAVALLSEATWIVVGALVGILGLYVGIKSKLYLFELDSSCAADVGHLQWMTVPGCSILSGFMAAKLIVSGFNFAARFPIMVAVNSIMFGCLFTYSYLATRRREE